MSTAMEGFLPLWVVQLIYRCGTEEGVCCVERLVVFPLPSDFYQCDRCLSSQERGGSWLGCQVLPAIIAVSILELAANSGNSRMSQAHNLHLAM